MAGDLQATVEISVEFSTFHNVDLFQRGYYQIRCSLKPPDKAISCTGVEYRRNNGDYQPDDCLYPAMVTPTGLTAVSQTFQILYRNEDIVLSDSFVFRLSMLVDSNKVTEQIDQADVQLLVELFFSDAEVGPDSPDSLDSVSSQVVKLHLSCIKGLHHHVPILFDYFHFAIIDTTVHAMLVKLSLPDPSILKVPKSSWFSKTASNSRISTPLFYAKLFGNKPLSNVLNSRTPAEERQIRFAYDTHRSLCSTLLSAQVNLLAYFECLSEYLPQSQQIQIGSLDFGDRLDGLIKTTESIQNPNEVFSQICSDLDNVSMEVSLVWSQFLESFTLSKRILPHFRDEHHRQRIGHFSEAFFVQHYAWDELQIHSEQSFQLHQSLGHGIKNSRYYQTIPSVAVECPNLDGDTSSTPIIFEDKYSFTTPEQEEASFKSDPEDIDFILDADDCQHENYVDDDELVILETDFQDTQASRDDPHSSFPLSGVICNGGRPVRETMILDDNLESGNSDLNKVLDEIERLEHPSKSAWNNDEFSKISPCENRSGSEKHCKLDNVDNEEDGRSGTAPESVAAHGESNSNEQNVNLISGADVISEIPFSRDEKEDEEFLMDLSLQKALLEQYESQMSQSKPCDEESVVEEVSKVNADSNECSRNENESFENSNLNKVTDSGPDLIQQTLKLESDIPSTAHQVDTDNSGIVSNEEVQISIKETQDGVDVHVNTNSENESREKGTQEVQVEVDQNDKTTEENESLNNSPTVYSASNEPSTSVDGDVAVIPGQEEDFSDNLFQSEPSSVGSNQDNGSVYELPFDGELASSDDQVIPELPPDGEVAPSDDQVIPELPPDGEVASSDDEVMTELRPDGEVASSDDQVIPELPLDGEVASSDDQVIPELPPDGKVASSDDQVMPELPPDGEVASNDDQVMPELPPDSEVASSDDQVIPELPPDSEVASSDDQVIPELPPDSEVAPSDDQVMPELPPDATVVISSAGNNDEPDPSSEGPEVPLDGNEKESSSSTTGVDAEEADAKVQVNPNPESVGEYIDRVTSQDDTSQDDQISNLKPSSSEVTFLSAQEAISTDSVVSDSHSDSSVYGTPSSSQATTSPSGSQPEVSTNTDGPKTSAQQQQQQKQDKVKKTKKKLQPKGLAITACLPVSTCAGHVSPSFTRGNSTYGGSVKSRFELAKRFVKRQLKFSYQIYSDIGVNSEREAYFSKDRPDTVETHLIVCVHGLDGNSGDLRLFRCYLEMALPSTRIDFLMSEVNQGDTFVSFDELTDRLVQEIRHFIDAYSIFPSKISFVGHSLGNIIIRSALSHPDMRPLLDRMYTLLSLSGPHVGMLYPTSPLVSTGLWLMQKWKKSEALMQLSLNDHEDPRQTCIYRLSQSKGFEYFKNVLLVSSVQDHYVPYHSARVEMCKAAAKDTSEYGTIYREMISNILSPLKDKTDTTLVRYSCYHALTSSANSFIGRAAHIAMLDSELFIEKLLLVSAADYFI